jgi:hypothetical protein
VARLGSWDIGGYGPTWFDIDANVGGWFDRDLIPQIKAPPPPPPPTPPAPILTGGGGGFGGGGGGGVSAYAYEDCEVEVEDCDPCADVVKEIVEEAKRLEAEVAAKIGVEAEQFERFERFEMVPLQGPEGLEDEAPPALLGGAGWVWTALAAVVAVPVVKKASTALSTPSTELSTQLRCHCVRCGHRWTARGVNAANVVRGVDSLKPRLCPGCRSPFWENG